MNENTFKQYVNRNMRGRWLSRQIETGGTGAGVPDRFFSVQGSCGMIEFKYHSNWPSLSSAIIRIKNTKRFINQRNFIWSHGQLNGRMFFFIKICNEYLLFDYKGTRLLNNLTKQGMMRHCIGYWSSKIDFSELEFLLKKDYRNIEIGNGPLNLNKFKNK